MEKDARRQELSDFLKKRRLRLSPDDFGLAAGQRRRAAGLRREEVAQLAGISVDWYTWLEQGRDIHVSEQVLTSLSRALRLTPSEAEHFLRLAHGNLPIARVETVSPSLQLLVDMQATLPAFVMGRRWDVLAWNKAAVALFGNFADIAPEERNVIWLTFTNPFHRVLLRDWPIHARRLVSEFRMDYGAYPGDLDFRELVERLNRSSPEFAEWWPLYSVQARGSVRKQYDHPRAGLLTMEQVTLNLHDNPQLRLVIQVPQPDTPTLDRLHAL